MLLEKITLGYLHSLYGPLLTERQQRVLDWYLNQDFSLAEIGEQLGISRQGAHDLLRRSRETLIRWEDKLAFGHRLATIRQALGEELTRTIRLPDKERELLEGSPFV
jgi:predicted DNA-binding protein YlxM (UPF0122 family)